MTLCALQSVVLVLMYCLCAYMTHVTVQALNSVSGSSPFPSFGVVRPVRINAAIMFLFWWAIWGYAIFKRFTR